MADLSGLKSADRTIEITNPATGDNIGVRITLMSIDDERMKRIKRRYTDQRLQLEKRGKIIKAQDIDENWNNVLFNGMIGWEWYNPTGKAGDKDYNADAMPDFGGSVPDFNYANVIKVLEALPWFTDQVGDAINDTKAFFSTSKLI